MGKVRYYVTPSSLGSYFGVGFNSPEEQFLIDTGEVKVEFDDEAIRRMELGNHLEDATVEYFQNVILKTPITDRNEEVKFSDDGKVKYQIDGRLELEGVPAIFENKISNAHSGRFTDNLGYVIQLQTYMMYEGVDKGVLGGIYQGRPIFKIYDKDEELQADIRTMIDFIYNALQGMVDFYEDYPVDILDKYGEEKIYEPIESLSSTTIDYLKKLGELQAERSRINKEIRELEALHENDFEITEGVYDDDEILVRVGKYKRRGSFDVDLFKEKNPYIDLTDYYKPDTEYTRKTIKLK